MTDSDLYTAFLAYTTNSLKPMLYYLERLEDVWKYEISLGLKFFFYNL